MWNLLDIRRTSRRPIWEHIVARQTERTPHLCRSCCEKYHGSARPPRPCDWRSRLYWWPLNYIVDPHCNQKIETATRYINPFVISMNFVSLNSVPPFKKLHYPGTILKNIFYFFSNASKFILNYFSSSPIFISLTFVFYLKIVTRWNYSRVFLFIIIFYYESPSIFTLCIPAGSIPQGIERSFKRITGSRRRDLERMYKSLLQFVEFV